jgi:hypothetical protein
MSFINPLSLSLSFTFSLSPSPALCLEPSFSLSLLSDRLPVILDINPLNPFALFVDGAASFTADVGAFEGGGVELKKSANSWASLLPFLGIPSSSIMRFWRGRLPVPVNDDVDCEVERGLFAEGPSRGEKEAPGGGAPRITAGTTLFPFGTSLSAGGAAARRSIKLSLPPSSVVVAARAVRRLLTSRLGGEIASVRREGGILPNETESDLAIVGGELIPGLFGIAGILLGVPMEVLGAEPLLPLLYVALVGDSG